MITIEETIDIAVPVRTAYDQWTQFKSFPRFMALVKRVEQVKPNITTWVVGKGPVCREFEAEIVEQEPDSHVSWRSLGCTPSHEGRVTFRPTADGGGTTVEVRLDLRPRGLAGAVAAVPGLIRGVVRAELRRFKEYIEGMGQAGGSWRETIRGGHVHARQAEPPRSRVAGWPVG
ncbi:MULTISPECIES: SRPBCC family protein [Streptomyces]|jgi:uncharacterized membrane protein|uniref:SRPBCC family protein n=1 Tax=Streptomyces thermoviolaceus subsp. thermoviolaceus TaxID=66860 RepID=A0ABX0YY57_STRTL|nr:MULTISPECIES: SRPBCC family protein [Streptomyces]MCM3266758.1 SRPBCC family protein [Streptomyces thermoviolaceus]NJP17353.1 SRPBCC family protein [Streptomyces thermoviolaceus subsp. thermoviolaceus]RSR95332.1 SRPBCC family protein [Streptomyces sp. WAC00469]WTD50601.1 SRPBCC family protein [Streptomyces thermoviolaceus]GGV76056.1 cyclase [Streptomyces thermoviolaceus subsp. apingens]